ncbi:MAG: DsbA family protein [Nitrospiraceae bacterium]
MELSPPSFRIVPFAVGAVVVLGLVAVASLLFFKRETSVMESAAAVGRLEPSPDRLWQPDGRTRGNPKAPVTLIEYSDFTCGYCVKFFRETWPRLREKYVETGKVRLLYRDYPRDPDGPAMTAAIAARCAGDQGRYWDMHDRLFAGKIEMDVLQAHAKTIGLNQPAFATCLRDAHHRQAILQDKADGIRIGFVGTPGFVLLRTEQAGKEKPIALPGAFPADVFEQEIDRLLKPAETKNRS